MSKYYGDRQVAEKEDEDWRQEHGFIHDEDPRVCSHGIILTEDCPECFFENMHNALTTTSTGILKDDVTDIRVKEPRVSKEESCDGDASRNNHGV